MKKTLLFFAAGLVLILAGCQANLNNQTNQNPATDNPTSENQNTGEPNIGLANPAATNCLEKGGNLETRKNKIGEYGVCLFEDNRQCEEWALLRGQCPVGGVKVTGYDNEAEIYCAIAGGQVEDVGADTPMCKRVDGTLCNAQANLDGDCPDPNDPNPSAGNVEAL